MIAMLTITANFAAFGAVATCVALMVAGAYALGHHNGLNSDGRTLSYHEGRRDGVYAANEDSSFRSGYLKGYADCLEIHSLKED